MAHLLIISYYLISAVTDIMDKVLLTASKIRPLSYTFYTVITGTLLLVIWPGVFERIPLHNIGLDVFSGIIFSLAIYVFFKALSQGEASRVIPFVFAIVPLTDILIATITGRNLLTGRELAALCLLIPGAGLIAYQKDKGFTKHVLLKLSSAFLWSVYYALWQYAAREGGVLNHLMWNRLGAALILILLLVVPFARKNIFIFNQVKNKKQASVLFIIKQVIGGANFILFSFLLVISKISIVNGLQGFRYAFLFIAALVLSHYHSHILKEQVDKRTVRQKIAAIILIFIGTAILSASA